MMPVWLHTHRSLAWINKKKRVRSLIPQPLAAASSGRKSSRLRRRNAMKGVLFTSSLGSWLASPLPFFPLSPFFPFSFYTPSHRFSIPARPQAQPLTGELEYRALGINAALSEMSTVALQSVRLWGSCNGYWSTVRLMQSCPATTRASCSTKICMRWAKTEKIEKKEHTVSSPLPSSSPPSIPPSLAADWSSSSCWF